MGQEIGHAQANHRNAVCVAQQPSLAIVLAIQRRFLIDVRFGTEVAVRVEIEVDGGVDDQTIVACREAGADVFVAGSFVFNGNIEENIEKLRAKLV